MINNEARTVAQAAWAEPAAIAVAGQDQHIGIGARRYDFSFRATTQSDFASRSTEPFLGRVQQLPIRPGQQFGRIRARNPAQ